ncbi:MAG: ATP-binding protein [Armatimonadota bacterium]|nr:ATP-binding protein [Armatimonadota bacterium]
MMNYLRIKGFKCWQDTGDINLNRITGFFGANSSGKTSLLQFLLMLKQTAESPDLSQVLKLGGERSLIDLGGWNDLRYRAGPTASSDSLSWSMVWTLPQPFTIENPVKPHRPLFSTNTLDFHAVIKDVGAAGFPRPVMDEFLYSFGAANEFKIAGMTRKNDAENSYELSADGFNFKRIQGRPWPLPSPIKCYGFPPQVGGYYQNAGFVPTFALAFEELVD